MEAKIVPAKLSDLDAIRQFLLSEYYYNRDDPDKATPDFFGLREEALKDIIDSLPDIIQDDDIIFLLIKSKKWGHVLGWAQIAPYKPYMAEMSSLYLTTCMRRRNIGDFSIKEVVEYVKHRGYKEMFTIIQSKNLVAKHFLTNHGFILEDTFELDTDVFKEELKPLKVDKYTRKLV